MGYSYSYYNIVFVICIWQIREINKIDCVTIKYDIMNDYIVKFELNDTTYELPFSADVNSSTVLKQCAEQWVEDYVNQTIKSGMVQWRILSVREDEK